jgi:hypothetical protein
MTRSLLVVSCLFLAALPVRAQEQKWDAFGGYQFTAFQVLQGYAAQPPKAKGNGWDAAFGYSINDWLGVKADFSGSYGSGGTQLGVSNGPANLYTFTFGPSLSLATQSLRTQNVRPFVEFLAGGYRNQVQYFSNAPLEGLALMAGGGIDAQFREHLAWRIEADWLGFMSGTNGFSYGSKSNFRFSTGLVIRF